MKLPIEQTHVCQSGIHCGTCRNLDSGKRFREAHARLYAVPGEAVDFACPLGKEWGYVPPAAVPVQRPTPPSRGLGDTIAKITSAVGIKPCGGCKERQAALNKLVPYSRDVVENAGIDGGAADAPLDG